jgi:hypothetical protein
LGQELFFFDRHFDMRHGSIGHVSGYKSTELLGSQVFGYQAVGFGQLVMGKNCLFYVEVLDISGLGECGSGT